MSQQRRQREIPHRLGPFDRHSVAAAEDHPGVQRQGRTNGIGQLFTGLGAQLGELRREHLERGRPQLVTRRLGAFNEGRMANELAGGDAQGHDLVENLAEARDH